MIFQRLYNYIMSFFYEPSIDYMELGMQLRMNVEEMES